MRTAAFPRTQLLGHFYERKVLTMPQLLGLCGCSRMTAWRALSEHGYYTSYNYNASYYTLADIPTFDDQGLWTFQYIRFSQHGCLTQTLTALIEQGAAGWRAHELTELLGVNVAPALSRLYGAGRVHREKLGAAFVYVAQECDQRQAQVQARQTQDQTDLETSALPDPDQIIAVLVELIQRPELQPKALAVRLRRRGVPVTARAIQAILTRYDLAGKRGRPNG
jgi:hypothetical protein